MYPRIYHNTRGAFIQGFRPAAWLATHLALLYTTYISLHTVCFAFQHFTHEASSSAAFPWHCPDSHPSIHVNYSHKETILTEHFKYFNISYVDKCRSIHINEMVNITRKVLLMLIKHLDLESVTACIFSFNFMNSSFIILICQGINMEKMPEYCKKWDLRFHRRKGR